MPIIWVKYYPPSGLLVNKHTHPSTTLTSQQMNIAVRRLKLRLQRQATLYAAKDYDAGRM
jgi:hypothetical protein